MSIVELGEEPLNDRIRIIFVNVVKGDRNPYDMYVLSVRAL